MNLCGPQEKLPEWKPTESPFDWCDELTESLEF